MHCFLLGIVSVFVFPVPVFAQVVISEIAWMGSLSDANNEWIELHNTEETSVDVAGWTLAVGDSFIVTLEGTISGGAYILLERTDDDSEPSVAMFQKYTGALPNTGATLILKDAAGTKVDTVIGGENWGSIGGSNETKDTPQRTETASWITSSPTPARATATGGSATETITQSNTQTNTQTSTSNRKGGGGAVIRGSAPQPRAEPQPLTTIISAPSIAYVHQAVSFEAESQGPGKTILNSLEYAWSFGDTFTESGKTPTHTFTYPGEYTVVVEAQYGKQVAQARHEISVLPASLTLSRGQEGEIIIKNLSVYEIDLGGFTLQSDTSFVFPKFTIIKQGGTLTVPPTRVIGNGTGIVLFDTHRSVIASVGKVPTAHVARLDSSARTVSTQGDQTATINAAAVTPTETPVVPNGVIRIGNNTEVSEQSRIGRFFHRLARMLGL